MLLFPFLSEYSQAKELVCVPVDVTDTLRCFRETLEKSKYHNRSIRHSRKLLSLFLAQTQGKRLALYQLLFIYVGIPPCGSTVFCHRCLHAPSLLPFTFSFLPSGLHLLSITLCQPRHCLTHLLLYCLWNYKTPLYAVDTQITFVNFLILYFCVLIIFFACMAEFCLIFVSRWVDWHWINDIVPFTKILLNQCQRNGCILT